MEAPIIHRVDGPLRPAGQEVRTETEEVPVQRPGVDGRAAAVEVGQPAGRSFPDRDVADLPQLDARHLLDEEPRVARAITGRSGVDRGQDASVGVDLTPRLVEEPRLGVHQGNESKKGDRLIEQGAQDAGAIAGRAAVNRIAGVRQNDQAPFRFRRAANRLNGCDSRGAPEALTQTPRLVGHLGLDTVPANLGKLVKTAQ